MAKTNRVSETWQEQHPVEPDGSDKTEKIAQRAYQYWEARGREDGYDLEDWLRAEQELAPPVGGQLSAK